MSEPQEQAPPSRTDGTPLSVLVTGAAGFIGSHVCDRLLEAGHHVWGVDNFDDSYPSELKRRNLSDAVPRPGMHLVEGDIRDGVLLDGLFADVPFDAVVHLAARSGIQNSVEAPGLFFEANVMGSLDLLEALRRHGVGILILGSSTAVNGEDNPLPVKKTMPADHPVSPLAVSKHAVEVITRSYHDMYGLSVHCLRFPSVYGPRQRPDLPPHSYARLMANGRPVPVNDEPALRDVIHVADAVDAVTASLRALRRAAAGGDVVFEALDLPAAEGVELADLVRRLGDALGLDARTSTDASLTGEITRSNGAAAGRAAELLDFEPTVGLEEGLRDFADWFWGQSDVEPGTDGGNGAKGAPQEAARGG